MGELTNLTDRLSHLRDRKGGSDIVRGQNPKPEKPPVAPKTPKAQKAKSKPARPLKINSERKFAPDYFMFFAYTLLGIALGAQLFLILWLDLL